MFVIGFNRGCCFLWLGYDTCFADVHDPVGDHIASDHNEGNHGSTKHSVEVH